MSRAKSRWTFATMGRDFLTLNNPRILVFEECAIVPRRRMEALNW